MDKEFLGIVAAGVLAVATVALARRQSLFFQLLDVTLRVAALATFFSTMLRTRSARVGDPRALQIDHR
jgi:hypothetical protein